LLQVPSGIIFSVRDYPSAKFEVAAGVLVRTAGSLDDAIQADELTSYDPAHACLRVSGLNRFRDATFGSHVNRQSAAVPSSGSACRLRRLARDMEVLLQNLTGSGIE